MRVLMNYFYFKTRKSWIKKLLNRVDLVVDRPP